ncbi:Zinc finger C-x8-C-x5-C-x3-H type family protein, putative isoform 3 [Hibiscus syriacus]|uniref:Zinc finger C-x8-C-x5-C-x3-H type family protein, putative isoform 3 n=1 Tax=Hibiscus syriacus TaxID=106335 RepID=A0A6A2WFK0_HIBSY|nr:Zinc finger C-x8-C-x5-C-x3-H type family protein, putative isoform 3 [Hibiscus syriacus]
MVNRHNLYLTHLREAAREAEELRQENSSLRSVNRDLNKQPNALIQAFVRNHFSSSDYDTSSFELANALQGLYLGGDAVGEADISDESPTSMMEGARDVDQAMFPKRIFVRSNGYLKTMNQAGASHRVITCGPTRTVNTSQLSGAVSLLM